jgi:hypothetical protein
MNKQLKELCAKANEDELRQILIRVFGLNGDVDARIESMLLTTNPKALASALKKRISSIKRGRSFIDYRKAEEFSCRLDAIGDDIALLIESAPQLAFELLDAFIATHVSVYERADDSSGNIGASYQEAVTLWLKAACACRALAPETNHWVELVFKHHNDNDYAVWDDLISGSAPLLNEDELNQLVRRFEMQFKQAKTDDNSGYCMQSSYATLGIEAVAQALGSVVLFERAMHLRSPSPNELQKASLVEFCLSMNDGESALKWLDGSWSGYKETTRLGLLDKTLGLLGQHDELVALRRQQYELQPDHYRLNALLEVSSGDAADEISQQALGKVLTISDLTVRLSALIELGAIDIAGGQVIEHRQRCHEIFYSHLGEMAKVFVKAKEYLAAVVCYRRLLEEILNDARSTAYDYAASYYQKLAMLDGLINGYLPMSDWQDYQAYLRQTHGRKSAFWRRID